MKRTVIAVPIFGMTRELPILVSRLIESVPLNVTIFLIDDGSKDDELTDFLHKLESINKVNLKVLVHETNLGFIDTCNRVITENPDSDVILINSDVIVSNSWFKRIQAAAYSDNTISTVSTWTNNGSILSVDMELSNFESIETQIDKINEKIGKSDNTYPTILVSSAHLLYLRRAALNVVGLFDKTFGYGYAEEVDYSLRAIERGFRNVIADDVYVYHNGSVSFGKHPEKSNRKKNENLILTKYKYFQLLLDEFHPKIEFLHERFLKRVHGSTLAIDGSCFSYPHSGTSEITLEIIKQLNSQSNFKVTVFLDRNISNSKLEKLLEFDKCSVKFFGEEESHKFDYFWRPYQIWESDKLEWILGASEHFILGIQDLIAYDNPSYHGSPTDWISYRNVMSLASQKASACTYISEYSRQRSIESGISNSNFNVVIPNGIVNPKMTEIQENPNLINRKKGKFSVLLIGLDYPHKNYDYGLRLIQKLCSNGYAIELHHIGAPIKYDEYPILQTLDFVEHGEVSDTEKYEIYSVIDLVFYLSTVEGFGLIPFELALLNIPVFSTQQGGLAEYLPGVGFYSNDMQLEADIHNLIQFFENPEIANQYIFELRNVAKNLSWEKNVESHMTLFLQIDDLHRYKRQVSQVIIKETELAVNNIKVLRILKIADHLFPVYSLRRKIIKKLIGFF